MKINILFLLSVGVRHLYLFSVYNVNLKQIFLPQNSLSPEVIPALLH